MAKSVRRMLRAKEAAKRSQLKRDKKFMRHRKESLGLLPNTIREWAKNALGGFEGEGLPVGHVMPKRPGPDSDIWRVVFVLPDGIQCAECGATSNDGEARYTIFSVDGTKWLSVSCADCHKTREPGNTPSPQKGDA